MAKVRGMFGLDKEEKLVSFYQCSVRAEKNAIKDEHAHVGEIYVFSQHVCFDLKVFAFHKQLVIESREIQALLKTGAPVGKDGGQCVCRSAAVAAWQARRRYARRQPLQTGDRCNGRPLRARPAHLACRATLAARRACPRASHLLHSVRRRRARRRRERR